MPITVSWYQEAPAVLRLHFEGLWTWDEMHAAHETMDALLDEHAYPVALIYDFLAAGSLPPNALSGIRSLNRNPHPHSAETYLVGLNTFYRLMIDTYRKVYGNFANRHAVIPCSTLAEALSHIARRAP
ncbi:MAG: hypothetical protein MUE40_20890 [Anaerolineae bacterium]|jgi:hypothetical protein|nr:hypothetical protein [Anaerolineae bacterium]